MNSRPVVSLAKLAVLLALPIAATAQAPQAPHQTGAPAIAGQPVQSGTLTIAGQPDQVPLVQINGRTYVDIESLARATHGSIRFQGSKTILELPSSAEPTPSSAQPSKPPQLSEDFLRAEIEALTQIREWRVTLVYAVQNNTAVMQGWVGPLQRSADSKLQLAVAAASTVPDHEAVELLRNEFASMQQMSNQFLALHAKSSYTPPDSFDNNSLDRKILDCERGLVSMAATKQFVDEPSCH